MMTPMETGAFKPRVSNGRRHIHHRIRYDSSSDSDKFYDESLEDDIEIAETESKEPKLNLPNLFKQLSSNLTFANYLGIGCLLLLYFLFYTTTTYTDMIINNQDELLFFNVLKNKALAPLSAVQYQKNGPAIATLVTNRTKDIYDLRIALQSLIFLEGEDEDPAHPAPVLIFNEGDLTGKQVEYIVSSTYRPVAFPIVNLSTFPKGFQSKMDDGGPEFYVKDRKPWGYYQMIRFWITGIWKHPALEGFETIMRIDSDSCFKATNQYLPKFAHNRLVYHSQFMGYEAYGDKFIEGLYEFVHKYIHENNIPIQNPLLWQFISTTWEAKGTLPLYNTNFEVSRKSFMLRPDVMDFHESLTEREPFGVLTHRWGDAVTRMLTTSIFAKDEDIMQSAPEGYFHKDQCGHDEVVDLMREYHKTLQ